MWPAAIVALMVGGPFGAVLLLSAGIMSAFKLAKIDREYAKRGEMPPSARLIDKWLDGRKTRGQAPKTAKPAKYGMWRYGWQRWQAMWESASKSFELQHRQALKDKAQAIAEGRPVPQRPSLKEQATTAWQWVVDTAVGDKSAAAGPEQPKADADPDAQVEAGDGLARILSEPRIACEDCGQTLTETGEGWQHPSSAGCPVKPAPQPVSTAKRRGLYDLGPDNCFACNEPGAVIERPNGRTFVHNRTGDRCPAIEPLPDDPAPPVGVQQPAATTSTPATEGEPMAQATQSGEVTGIPSAVHYLHQMAAVHRTHADNEALVARLADMKVGEGDQGLVRAAMAASSDAADLYDTAGTELEVTNANVREGYGSAPEAADKQPQLAE